MRTPREPTDPIEIYFHRVHWEYNHLIEVIGRSSRGLENQKRSVRHYYKKQEKKYPQDWQGIDEALHQNLYRFDNNYHIILRNSFLMAAYSLFESSLLEITRLAEPLAKSGKKYKKQNDDPSYAEGCVQYLQQEISIDLQHLKKQWSFLNEARIIRNQIVHENSRIPAQSVATLKKKRIFKILSKLKSFTIDNKARSFRMEDNEYLLDVCKTGRNYLRGTVNSYLKVYSKSNKV